MPNSSSTWLPQSAAEWTASASIALEPVTAAATPLAIRIPLLAPSAYSTARIVEACDMNSPSSQKNFHGGSAGLDFADHRGAAEAFTAETIEHPLQRAGRAGHQQPAAGLRIGKQRLHDVAMAAQVHALAVAIPVSGRGAGLDSGLHQIEHTRKQRHLIPAQRRRHPGTLADFEQMSGQPETGNVGQRMDALQLRKPEAGGVELGGARKHCRIA